MRGAARTVLLLIMASSAAIAQNSDLGLLFGPSLGTVHNAPDARLSEDLGFANQYAYAWQVLDTQAGGLYVEVPFNFAGYTSGNTRDGVARGGTNSYLFTPGLRFKFSLHSRLSLYTALGAGLGIYGVKYIYYAGPSAGTIAEHHTTSGVVDFGGGVDYRLTKLLSLRGEARDFVSRHVLGTGSGRNFVLVEAGIGFHF
jgi:hypothetical protein